MHAKIIKTFNMGSSVFFNKFDDYKQKDIDLLHFIDNPVFGNNIVEIRHNNYDEFYIPINKTKQEIIEHTLSCKLPLVVGKFLVPDFVEYINFTIDELPIFNGIIQLLDDKHKYEKIIYNSYIKNKKFTINSELLLKAYDKYKKYR